MTPTTRPSAHFVVFLVVLLLALCRVDHARADGVADEAELHFQRGAECYGRSDFPCALEHFLASNRLAPNRNVMFNIARTFEQLGRFADAYRWYEDARRGETDRQTIEAIEDALGRISPRVGVLDIETDPPGATVFINRKDLGSVGTGPARLGLAPGTYTVLAEHPGHRAAQSQPMTIAAGSRTPVKLVLPRIVGKVEVEGADGFSVHVDDEAAPSVCTSPCAFDLAPGPHVLYFSRAGFAIVPRQVTVVADQSVRVKAQVVALTGSILVSADEPNALIEVDGKALGFTPTVLTGVAVGKRRVRVSLRGFQPFEAEVEVKHDQETELRDVRLVPVREVAAASRRVEQIEDAPASVTVISAQELRAFNYPTIFEALRGVRGMALTNDSIYGNAAVRGLGQPNDYNNRLLVLSDGAILNENILYQPFISYDGRVDLGDVERIEVVRGPGSVLYGTGAVSGVINLVTRPRGEGTSYEVGVGAVGPVARARASFNLALAKDAGMWASVSGARSDGLDATLRFDADGDGRVDEVEVRGVDQFRAITTAGRAWFQELTLQWFYTAREVRIPTGSAGTIVGRDENLYDDRRLLVELRWEPRLGEDWQLMARTTFNRGTFHLDYLYDAEADTEVGPVAWQQPYVEDYAGTWITGELRVTWEPTRALRLSLGGEIASHFDVTMTNGQLEYDGTSTTLLELDAPYKVFAGYAVFEWSPSARLRLVAGVRADRWDLSQDALSAATGQAVAEDFTSVNPRVAVIFKPSTRNVIKVMGGRAFRAPSTYEYFYTDGATTQVTSDCCGTKLGPESVLSGEVEVTHRLTEDWSGQASLYGIYAQDVIETVEVPSEVAMANGWDEGLVYYRNSDVAQVVVGGDVEVRRDFRAGSMLAATYGYVDARYAEAIPDVEGRRVTNVPHHYASFRGIVPVIPGLVTGAMRMTLESPRRIDSTDTDETGWALIGDVVLSGSVARAGVSYSVGLYNMFDWKTELPVSPFASRTMPQPGRTLLLSLTVTR
jgi:outer membrane receptor for ferrienterochelin and colicins